MARTWMRGIVCLCSLALLGSIATAQEKKPTDEPKKAVPPQKEEAKKPDAPAAGQREMSPEMQEMMKKWAEYATPGEAHKRLGDMVGKWEYKIRWWMNPEAPPEESQGTAEMKWIFDGRYIAQVAKGPAEGPEGKPFEGHGLYGYDNGKKQYFSTWYDNMGTGIMIGWGTYDEASKSMKMGGEDLDPMSGKMKKWRSACRTDTKDKFVYEMFVTGPDGKEYKEMELTYTRAVDAGAGK